MAVCLSCSVESPPEARFCMSCGAELTRAEPAREQRKVVTVLFCDLVGSTALGESTDPEALRARMRRYFDDLRVILERHGGTVEKFVGDAVMAVFGIPVSHEDDALRAARAASEMRQAIGEHGLEARIGINTGGVVVGGEGETLVTGDAVNVAARLEQAATAGEILIGAETRLLVRDAVLLEPVEPLALKGKSEPVQAFRLLEVIGGAAPLARHPETLLVGRERERQRLWRDYEDAVADSTCRLFTLLGPAGIGKSRLVSDLLERIGGVADILRGRCLSYGEGITYWPLVEILIAIGVEPDTVIGGSPPETQLTFRRMLEARATERAQVVVIDDLQWAEPVFVDLVEHIADLSRDAPIFLLCVARTELLDVRPGWGGGKVNATSLLLEPLAREECADLMDRLVPDAVLDPVLRERITDASAGNPLYVEEMLAMVREHGGDGEIVVPPTIHALLQARIDVLDGDVRVVMERGSVEGEVFHRGAVAALSPVPVKGGVDAHLATLVRKELIRSTPSTFPMDEGFRFRHLLIRDAAYESLPKATRAELHEQFATWLSTHELVEGDELVGYHLEQAHRYRAELNPGDEALPRLAARASERLATAGSGALDRADFNAGVSLLRRASAVLPVGDQRRLALAPELAAALGESGNADEAFEILEEASAAEDVQTRARAAVTRAIVRQQTIEGGEAIREAFERAGDEYGLALYWCSVAWNAWSRVLCAETAEACERALACLARAGVERGRVADSIRARLVTTYIFGPIHVDEAVDRVEALIAEGTGQVALAYARVVLGRLCAMRAEFDKARELVAGARQSYRDAGMLVVAGSLSMYESRVEWEAGNVAAAERTLEEGLAQLEEIGDRGFHGTVALMLAELRYVRGRYDDARALCASARITTEPSDLFNIVLLDSIEGCLLAREGHLEEALRQCRRAIEHTDGMDGLEARAAPRRYLAEALFLAGQTDEARTVAVEAIAIREAKGDTTGAARTRKGFEQIGLAVS
jgi:class 3 adenylate cyclase/tetratricopeptide (TPR) repeat protein